MATLPSSEIGRLALTAGFPSDVVPTMTAIALAESGGNPNAHNDEGPDDSYGLWQINMRGDMGPNRRKLFGISSNTELFNPSVNAKAAYAIYKSQGLDGWTTYTSGKYKEHLNGEAATSTANGAGGGSTSEAFSIAGSLSALGSNVFKAAANIQGIMIAIVLIVLGIVILARDIIPFGKVAKIAKKVAK